jgi:hypothetical protein
LIHLGLAPLTLQIDQLPDAVPPENVVAASGALLKPQPLQEVAQFVEIDVRIRLVLGEFEVEVRRVYPQALIYHMSSAGGTYAP